MHSFDTIFNIDTTFHLSQQRAALKVVFRSSTLSIRFHGGNRGGDGCIEAVLATTHYHDGGIGLVGDAHDALGACRDLGIIFVNTLTIGHGDYDAGFGTSRYSEVVLNALLDALP